MGNRVDKEHNIIDIGAKNGGKHFQSSSSTDVYYIMLSQYRQYLKELTEVRKHYD